MRLRVILGQYMVRLGKFMRSGKFVSLGKFISSLPVLFMRPDDLVEFSRQNYARPVKIETWGMEGKVESGLETEEKAILEKLPLKKGRLLVLGVGGGREAVPLARMGYEVTGVDFVPEMIEKARENARKWGAKISGLVQNMSRLDVPEGSYDIVWLFAGMYSSVPTRRRRVEMLKRIRRSLRPGGFFVCQFIWNTKGCYSPKVHFFRKLLAILTLGNFLYEKGDVLWLDVEFVHLFSSEDEIRSEFEGGRLEVVHINSSNARERAEAVLRKF